MFCCTTVSLALVSIVQLINDCVNWKMFVLFQVAMRLLEKDIHDKQDTLVSLRRQLEDVKKLNLELHNKLQVLTDIFLLLVLLRRFSFGLSVVAIMMTLYKTENLVISILYRQKRGFSQELASLHF